MWGKHAVTKIYNHGFMSLPQSLLAPRIDMTGMLSSAAKSSAYLKEYNTNMWLLQYVALFEVSEKKQAD